MDLLSAPELSVSIAEAKRLAVPEGNLSALALSHGTMELRMFQPGADDHQEPHDRDELYIVLAGTAVMLRGSARTPFCEPSLIEEGLERIPVCAGDAVMVPAGTLHHFIDIAPDFAAWCVFWGPEGGEVP